MRLKSFLRREPRGLGPVSGRVLSSVFLRHRPRTRPCSLGIPIRRALTVTTPFATGPTWKARAQSMREDLYREHALRPMPSAKPRVRISVLGELILADRSLVARSQRLGRFHIGVRGGWSRLREPQRHWGSLRLTRSHREHSNAKALEASLSPCKSPGTNRPSLRTSSPSNQISPPP